MGSKINASLGPGTDDIGCRLARTSGLEAIEAGPPATRSTPVNLPDVDALDPELLHETVTKGSRKQNMTRRNPAGLSSRLSNASRSMVDILDEQPG
jgi:hypothetical protein